MAKVEDVARFFIALAEQQNRHGRGDLMTNLRLQKLLYFAQGWHLQRYGRPLFDAAVEAWTYGPVVPSVYQIYKANGNRGIEGVEAPDDDAFTPDEFDLLMDVAREYFPYSTGYLVDLSHAPDSPWRRTQQSATATISQDLMRQYFSQKKQLKSFDDILDDYPVEVVD